MKQLATALFVTAFTLAFYSCSSRAKMGGYKDVTTLPAGVDSLYDLVQRQTFQYFWDGAEPVSGMALERIHTDGDYGRHSRNVVTSGGSGFGVMAILAAINRGYITQEQGRERLEKIIAFLEKADVFHGVWPHWWDGTTGKVYPFSQKDDGGDLVETAFMAQALLCVRQYYRSGNAQEKALAQRADQLWRNIDFDFYRNGKDVLYWHWSPKYAWEKNLPIRGYNECMIVYILAAASPTHGIPAEVYHKGWAQEGKMKVPHEVFDYPMLLKRGSVENNGGPLFFAHYSYLALDPRGLKDTYANYWDENVNQALINYTWCVKNPNKFTGYGPNSWGLTASYSVNGYRSHAPTARRDVGVIAPTAALASMPYTPQQSIAAMHNWYNNKRDKLWGPYGFYDAFSDHHNWYPKRYLAIDQGPIVVMMENYRSGMLWDLFMSSEEVQAGLKKLGFTSPRIK